MNTKRTMARANDEGTAWKRAERKLEIIGLIVMFSFYAIVMSTMDNQMAKAVKTVRAAAGASLPDHH